ncbi:hypothetical protein DPMN_087361 [Dreissena polymorpha]|uniref:Uncharacterized protein n=1 Tax=Dreissena polymorpha TaxID=45954 RepID=A0A9D4KS96_DREPO|nr:hypothetical protein DPMN_087361 [Dreissena polymorpha]
MLMLGMPAEIRGITEEMLSLNAPWTQQFAGLVRFDGVVHHIPVTRNKTHCGPHVYAISLQK